jgi:uncharacterized FlaG/YvyC family protein
MGNIREMLSNSAVEPGEGEPSIVIGRLPTSVLPASKLFDAESSKSVVVSERSQAVDLRDLAEKITHSLSGFKSLRLSMDRELKQVIVQVVDQKTNCVIRQIPGERMMDLVKQMRDLEEMLYRAMA